jgi:hypothetical protein
MNGRLRQLTFLTVTVTWLTVAAACTSVPSRIHEPSSIQNLSVRGSKPSVYLDVKFISGKPGEGNPLELPAVRPTVQRAVERVIDRGGVFSRYSFDPFDQDKMDRVVHLSFYNYGGGARADLAALLSGLTLGLVPTSATDHYTLVARVTETGQSIGPAQTSEGSITTKMGIWFVSGMNDTLEKAADATFEDLTHDALKKLIDSKQIRAKS